MLGHLYGPGDGKTFDGVIGKDLSNPIGMGRARRRPQGGALTADVDSPDPDSRSPAPADATGKLTRDTSLAAYLVRISVLLGYPGLC